jgi:hypothetical protein
MVVLPESRFAILALVSALMPSSAIAVGRQQRDDERRGGRQWHTAERGIPHDPPEDSSRRAGHPYCFFDDLVGACLVGSHHVPLLRPAVELQDDVGEQAQGALVARHHQLAGQADEFGNPGGLLPGAGVGGGGDEHAEQVVAGLLPSPLELRGDGQLIVQQVTLHLGPPLGRQLGADGRRGGVGPPANVVSSVVGQSQDARDGRTAMVRSQSCREVSSKEPTTPRRPALLNRQSSPPSSDTATSTIAATTRAQDGAGGTSGPSGRD